MERMSLQRRRLPKRQDLSKTTLRNSMKKFPRTIRTTAMAMRISKMEVTLQARNETKDNVIDLIFKPSTTFPILSFNRYHQVVGTFL